MEPETIEPMPARVSMETGKMVFQKSSVTLEISRIQDKFVFDMTCNNNNNPDTIVSGMYDKECTIDKLKKIFGEKTQFELYNEKTKMGLEIGYSDEDPIELYFEIIDYTFDSTFDKLPTHYTLTIGPDLKGYEQLCELYNFLKFAYKLEEGDVKFGYKSYNFKH